MRVFRAILLLAISAALGRTAMAETTGHAPPGAPDTPFLYDRQAGFGATTSTLGRGLTQDVRLQFSEPFLDGRLALRIETPMVYARIAEGQSASIGPDADSSAGPSGAPGIRRRLAAGDVSFRVSYLLAATRDHAVQGFLDLSVPTGTADTGAARVVASPTLSAIRFINPRLGVAAQYRHSLTFAGAPSASRIHLAEIDAFVFWRVVPGVAWLTFNPTQRLDFEHRRYNGGTFRVTAGLKLGEINGATVSAYLRPGLGLGRDRPYDWNVETGITISGF